MNANELKNALQSLHADLSSANQLDPEMIALLRTLDSDIHAILQNQKEKPQAMTDLSEQAQAYAARLAAEHPTLELTLRTLADTLGKMGI